MTDSNDDDDDGECGKVQVVDWKRRENRFRVVIVRVRRRIGLKINSVQERSGRNGADGGGMVSTRIIFADF